MNNTTIPFINIHTHHIPNSRDIAILNVFPTQSLPDTLPGNVYCSSGIHPWYLDQWKSQMERLIELAGNPRIIAIGECGLDKKASAHIEEQERVFCLHVEISEEYKKPLIIHCVKAFNELIQIRKNMKPNMPWIIHGFNASLEIAQQCIDMGMLLSFGKLLLNEKAKAASIAKAIPTSMIFFETDGSEIAIADIYHRYAEIKDIPIETLKTEIAKNFYHYFTKQVFVSISMRS